MGLEAANKEKPKGVKDKETGVEPINKLTIEKTRTQIKNEKKRLDLALDKKNNNWEDIIKEDEKIIKKMFENKVLTISQALELVWKISKIDTKDRENTYKRQESISFNNILNSILNDPNAKNVNGVIISNFLPLIESNSIYHNYYEFFTTEPIVTALLKANKIYLLKWCEDRLSFIESKKYIEKEKTLVVRRKWFTNFLDDEKIKDRQTKEIEKKKNLIKYLNNLE